MDEVFKYLDNLNITYKHFEHKAIFTVEESKEIDETIPGTHTKNLFIRNKKGNKHWLVIVKAHTRLDMNKLRKFLVENKLSFASAERMKEYLNLTPGSVSPFGLINDKNNEVVVVMYEDVLEENGTVNFHPNINTDTVNLSGDDFKKYLDNVGNKVIYCK